MNKEVFFSVVNKLKEDSIISSIIINKTTQEKNPNSRSQYSGVVFWYSIMFKDDIIVTRNSKRIVGINIMPYKITRDDIKKAKLKSKSFNKTQKNYVDFDSDSGNFHKHIYNGIQITLLSLDTKNDYGIGLFDNKKNLKNIFRSDNTDKKNEYADILKEARVLYPNIDDKKTNITFDNLKESVYKVLKELNVIE